MVKYRIKVMPWKGKLLYMPQSYNGFFWGYSDMFYLGSQSNYSDWQMGYMGSECPGARSQRTNRSIINT